MLGESENLRRRGGRNCSWLEKEILDMFYKLPDRRAFKIWAPATKDAPEFLVQLNAGQQMFMASTLKSIILCERLRQVDSASVEEKLVEHELALNKNVWSPGSTVFNPPDLSGQANERTAMEAMMIHGDDTDATWC